MDYYPFGMLVPQKDRLKSDYRYGFNGKEKDDEIKGEGNSYDYGFRIYDSRIGKFLSTDPLQDVYPELTPYQFASNSPIQGVDLDGREIYHYTLFFPTDGRKPILTYLGEQTNYPSGIWPLDGIDKMKSEGFKDYNGDKIKSKSIEVHVIARENNGIAYKPDQAKITFSYFSELNDWVKDGYSGSDDERAFILNAQKHLETEVAITQIQLGTPQSEEIVSSKVKKQQSAQSGRVLSKKEMQGITGKGTPPQGGAARAAMYSADWGNASLEATINTYAPNSTGVISSNGQKMIYENPSTGINVIHDLNGNYFRIENTNLQGKRVYLSLDGNIPNNKTVNGKQMGRSQSEYNQVTHFNNID